MGAEADCVVTFGRTRADGRALLETDELIFRAGDLRLAIPYKTISRIDAREEPEARRLDALVGGADHVAGVKADFA